MVIDRRYQWQVETWHISLLPIKISSSPIEGGQMLEKCVKLSDCEDLLKEAVECGRLLGEIPLTDQDIEMLAGFVRNTIALNISKGTRILKTKYPVSFACFLVGMGRFYDKEIGFWPIVERNVGAIDGNWKSKWGDIFKEFLDHYELPKFDEEEGLANVTPILGHVCIPDRCLVEYFDQVLVPLVNRVLLDPLDGEEIIHDLRTRRTINDHRLALERKKKEQLEKHNKLLSTKRNLEQRLNVYQAVAALIAKEAECERRRIALQGLEDVESARINYTDRIRAAAKTVRQLETDGRRIWAEIKALQKRYQPILDRQIQIDEIIRAYQGLTVRIPEVKAAEEALFAQVTEQWAALSSQPWEDHYGAVIIGLVIDRIRNQIEQVQILEEQQKKIQERIENLRASQKTVRKSPLPFLVPLILAWRIFFGAGRKIKKLPSDELHNLRAALENAKAEQQQKLAAIRVALLQLPIDTRQLEIPKADLHQRIVAIRQIYVQALEARETRYKLEQEAEDLIQRAQELASSIGIANEGQIGSWIDQLSAALVGAAQNQEHAQKALRILEDQIRPELEAARAKIQQLRGEIASLDERLADAGEGSVDQGLNRVREFHQLRAATALEREKLNKSYENFASLEYELKREGLVVVQARLEETAAQIQSQITDIENELNRLDQVLGRYPPQYSGIDEPIRRFLLYGGASSERMLRSSVFLFARAKAGERIEDISEPELSDRLIQHFRQWWEYYQARSGERSKAHEEINPATGERYRAPIIFFDMAAGEVVAALPAQRILRPERGTTVGLEVYSDEQKSPIYSAQLNLYSRSKGLVETQLCERILLTEPAEKYIFRLTHKGQPIHEWDIPGVTAQFPYLAFSNGAFKQIIKRDALPKAHIILVIEEELDIHPHTAVLTTGGRLYGCWSKYVWYELDLTTSEEICLIREGSQSIRIPLANDPGIGISLIGGQRLPNAVSNGRAVYNAPPDLVRIPITDQSDLHLLRFSIIAEDENRFRLSKHYQLSELTGIFDLSDEGWLDIPLDIEQFLGDEPFGVYTLRVYRPPSLDWQTTFCVVTGLGVSFDQKVYPPYYKSIPNVRAFLTIPERSTFQPDQPAVVLSKEATTWQVQVPATEDQITGILTIFHIEKGSITLSLTMIIPKIRWRLQGLKRIDYDQWLDHVEEELFLDDWVEVLELFLLVEIPDTFMGEVGLILSGNSKIIPCGRMLENKIRFDLKALEDKLRAGPPLEIIGISLRGDSFNFPSITLFTLRTRWLAERIKCYYYPEGDAARVDISWEEQGRAKQKAARLWYLSNGQPKLVQEQIVSPDAKETTFRSPAKEMRSGKYIVHLEPYDPWSSRATYPAPNDPNTTIIEILTTTPEKVVNILTVVVDPKHSYHLPHAAYRIHIIGKVINQQLPENADLDNIGHVLIAPLNENWYVGNLEVNGIPRVSDYLSDTNPVKFEYDSERKVITSIEDRHGDGAVYCFECRMLFWYQGTVEEEKRKKHKNYGPIEEILVEWE